MIRALEAMNIMIDDSNAFEECGSVIQDIVKTMKVDSSDIVAQSKDDHFRYTYDPNALTLMTEIWADLLHKTREIQELDAQRKITWIENAWKKDHLRVNWRKGFPEKSVPVPGDYKFWLQSLWTSRSLPDDPNPELTFGLDAGAFTELEQRMNQAAENYALISPRLYHAFFFVEASVSWGRLCDAQFRCCQSGAALVHARMQFNSRAATAKENVVGADPHSFVFSLTIIGGTADIHVHWAEVEESGSVLFHMNYVTGGLYGRKGRYHKDKARLRHAIDTILEWGTSQRKREIKDVCAKIANVNGGSFPDQRLDKQPQNPVDDK